MSKSFLSEEVRARLRRLLDQKHPDLSKLYPGKTAKDLSDDELSEILGEGKKPQEVLGKPEIQTAYYTVTTSFPNYEINFQSLADGQLERLTRGEPPEKVLEPAQYRVTSKTPISQQFNTKKPGIGHHYSSNRSARVHNIKVISPRRGINPRDERY